MTSSEKYDRLTELIEHTDNKTHKHALEEIRHSVAVDSLRESVIEVLLPIVELIVNKSSEFVEWLDSMLDGTGEDENDQVS